MEKGTSYAPVNSVNGNADGNNAKLVIDGVIDNAASDASATEGELEGTRHRHEIMTMLKESPDGAINNPLYKKLDKELKVRF
jgi:hypothetical protein